MTGDSSFAAFSSEEAHLSRTSLEIQKVEMELVTSMTAPIFWEVPGSEGLEVSGGSMCFVDTGTHTFGVTAAHVVEAYLDANRSPPFTHCMIARDGRDAYRYEIQDRIIDINSKLDLATLQFTAEDLKSIGRTVLSGLGRVWPPCTAREGSFVYYAGFPRAGRQFLAPRDISCGAVAMAGMITNGSERHISVQIERDDMQQVFGAQAMPENFDFGGMSGGPLLQIVERDGLRGSVLAGIVIAGPSPHGDASTAISGFEVIWARPTHFIKADGKLDIDRWEQSSPFL